MKNELIAVALLTAGYVALAGGKASAKYDPELALENAVVDTNGVKWIDGRYLPLEGKAFDDVDEFYDRLPSCVTTNVNGGVRSMKHHTSGMMFRFTTDSKTIRFSWKPYGKSLSMYHMASTGMSGIDVYRFDSKRGKWLYYRTGAVHDAEKGGSLYVDWTPGEPCLVNLPLYNGIKEFKIGIDAAARVDALPPRASGIEKPVVFYGTSITHGGCCTRPGLAFVNWIGRDLDVPVVGLGFSGAGRMELEMSEHLANIDASCYVLDCLWNMMLTEKQRPNGSVEGNYEKFIRNLRRLRPGVPIVMAEQCDVYCKGPCDKDLYIRALYEKLISEGWKDLYYLPKEVMFSDDQEGTVDGCHPNDLGMLALKNAYGEAVRKALKMPGPSPRPVLH